MTIHQFIEECKQIESEANPLLEALEVAVEALERVGSQFKVIAPHSRTETNPYGDEFINPFYEYARETLTETTRILSQAKESK
jgi:hypothetical protein